ncbi:MAG TPA: ABC transporter permease [Mycobacteriales bacterium]|nr:ABC transporter permease [Mycobacteriales bacterium]
MTTGNVGGVADLEVLPGGPDADGAPEVAAVIQGRSPWRLAFERLRRDRAAVISAAVVLLIVACAIGAPIFASITGHGVNEQFRVGGLTAEGFPVHPSGKFVLGTDDQGRDLLVRLAYGARISLLVGVVTTAITVTFGAIMGLMAGYFGRFVDTLISRIIDVTLSIPFLLFAVALAAVSGGGSLWLVIIVLSLFGWSSVARIVRGQVFSIREREYVEAARSLGASPWRIMFIDIFPNVIAQVIVYASLLIPLSIVGEATLSFLTIGVQAPTADWGRMIADSQAVYTVAWWDLVFPGLALLTTTLAFNIFGDGVRDAFDPRADRLFV